jgi:hypothetical protein
MIQFQLTECCPVNTPLQCTNQNNKGKTVIIEEFEDTSKGFVGPIGTPFTPITPCRNTNTKRIRRAVFNPFSRMRSSELRE